MYTGSHVCRADLNISHSRFTRHISFFRFKLYDRIRTLLDAILKMLIASLEVGKVALAWPAPRHLDELK